MVPRSASFSVGALGMTMEPIAGRLAMFDHQFPDVYTARVVDLHTEITQRCISAFFEPSADAQCAVCLEPTAMDVEDRVMNFTWFQGNNEYTFQSRGCLAVVCKGCYAETFARRQACPTCRQPGPAPPGAGGM